MLTSRDQKVLNLIQSYGFVSTEIIAKRHFEGVAMTTVLRRLRKLQTGKWIKQVNLAGYASRYWMLTKRSALLFSRPSMTYLPFFTFDHDVKLMEVRNKLEDSGFAHFWTPEHEIRSTMASSHGLRHQHRWLIPDAIVTMGINGYGRKIALELELNYKNRGRYKNIFLNYATKSSANGILYIVKEPTLGNLLLNLWKEKSFYHETKTLGVMLLDEVMKDPAKARIFAIKQVTTMEQAFDRKMTNHAHRPPAHLSGLCVRNTDEKGEHPERSVSMSFETETPAQD